MQKIQKPVSVLLALIMVLGLFTIVPFTVGATMAVRYYDENGENTDFIGEEVTSGTTSFSSRNYVVYTNTTISNRVTCTGNVRIILVNNTKLTLEKGIEVNEGNSITIYGQGRGDGNGTLEITGSDSMNNAALGSSSSKNSGTITINGGTIIATASVEGAAIGGGNDGNGTVIINGGKVNATADDFCAAIGGGTGGSGNVTINGGIVNAVSNGEGTAIGGGYSGSGTVTINGGTITATSSGYSAAIGGGNWKGGNITINGGTITATSSSYGAAIGGGFSGNSNVNINGGNITATSNGSGAAIGNGLNGSGSDIHLNWTNKTNSITASSYGGTVTLENYFHNGIKALNKGKVSDADIISGKTLSPFQGFAGHSISLNGDIGLYFYLAVPENSALHFEWYNKTYDHTITAEDFDVTSSFYKVKVNVAAAEMNFPITATCTYNGEVLATNTYSVRQYADKILDSESDFSKDYAAKNGVKKYGLLVDLIKKMLDYGAKAQTRFGVTDVALANSGVDYTMQPATVYHIKTQKSDMEKDLYKYGLNYIGTSVLYLSEMTLRHNYVVVDANLLRDSKDSANFDFVDKGTRVCFELKNIPAAQLDVDFVFVIGSSTYSYSVLDYCKLVIADESKPQSDRELAMATYWYNDAAKAYFYSSDEYEDDMV